MTSPLDTKQKIHLLIFILAVIAGFYFSSTFNAFLIIFILSSFAYFSTFIKIDKYEAVNYEYLIEQKYKMNRES